MNFRKMISMCMAGVLLLSLAACGGTKEISQPSTENGSTDTKVETKASDNADSQTKQKYKIRLQWLPQSQFAGYLVAKEKGYYKDAGLDVDVLMGGSADGMVELKDGEVEFATHWLSTGIQNASNGVPLQCVAQYFNKNSSVLVSKKAKNIVKPSDLNGKKIGVWEVGLFSVPSKALAKKENITPNFVAQDFTMDQLTGDKIDVASAMLYNEYNSLLESGLKAEDLNVINPADYGVNLPEDGLYTTKEFAQKNAEVVTKIVEATTKGWKYAVENKSEAVEIVMNVAKAEGNKTTIEHQTNMLNTIVETQFGNKGELSDKLQMKDFDYVKQVMKDAGLLGTTDVTFENFYSR